MNCCWSRITEGSNASVPQDLKVMVSKIVKVRAACIIFSINIFPKTFLSHMDQHVNTIYITHRKQIPEFGC